MAALSSPSTDSPAEDATHLLVRALEAPGAAARLRAALAPFDVASVAAVLGTEDPRYIDDDQLPLLRVRARRAGSAGVLARLFLLRDQVTPAEAAAALAPVPLDDWIAAGFLAPAGAGLTARVQLCPWEGLLVLTDLPGARELPRDHVMGLAVTTRKLMNLTPRRRVGRVLDLGTGCGVQALLCAAHADHVVATDINPRALRYARANALLNDRRNIELREGSLYAPVAGERFDLILSNPPFVASPDAAAPRYWFRDGGLAGDGLGAAIAGGARAHLNEGGVLLFLGNWLTAAGQPPEARVRGWLQDQGLEAWVMVVSEDEPLRHAANWIGQTEGRLTLDECTALVAAWAEHFEGLGVARVGFGVIVARRGAGPGFLSYEEAVEDVGPCGAALLRGLALRRLLAQTGDAALLSWRLRVAAELRLSRRLVPAAGGFRPVEDEIDLSPGLRARVQVGQVVLAMLSACDGQRPLRAVLAGLAAGLRQPEAAAQAALLPIVRELVRAGMLLPEDGALDDTAGAV